MQNVLVLSDDEFAVMQAQTLAISQLIDSTKQVLDGQVAMLAGLQHYTLEEVATFYKCTVRTVQNWGKPGPNGEPPKLLPIRIGGKVLYRGSDLLAFTDRLVDEQQRSDTKQLIAQSLPKAKRYTA